MNMANHDEYIPSLKHQMLRDSASNATKTRTHSQAPARKRERKGSWESLKTRVLARIQKPTEAPTGTMYFFMPMFI